MRFWDSSAIVPLVVNEASSPLLQDLYHSDTSVLVWAFTSTEVISALCRRLREGALDLSQLQASEERLRKLQEDWTETQDLDPVRQRAERLLHVHPLTAADSLQLAAALVATEERPQRFPFVTLEGRLGESAAREGFRIKGLPPVRSGSE
jgi:predicted nucleic acid-binding protein